MRFFKDKTFLKTMLGIAIPIALQNLITSSLNMVDTLMISSLGEASIAAVGLANQVFFFYTLLNFGVNTGSSIFISQYWGKRDIFGIRKILGLALAVTVFIGSIFTISGFFFPRQVMAIFIDDAQVIAIGSQYLRIISLSYIITGISFAYSIALRSVGLPRVPMLVSMVSFVVNTLLNYILIFGKLGVSPLGVRGAALGTLVARIVEILFLMYIVYREIGPLSAKFKDLVDWDRAFVKKYFKTVSPVIINEGFWSLGQIMYSIAFAKIGSEATAAVQLTITISNIFLVLVRGVASACAVMVGTEIGAKDKDKAYEYGVNFIVIAAILGASLGLVMILTPDLIMKIFRSVEGSLYVTTRRMLIAMGITFLFRTLNSTIVVGVLRGGGDTKYSMYLEMGSVWIIGVPLAFIGALVLKWPVYYVFLLVNLEEFIKFLISIPRIKSKKWIKDLT